jgi:hypothetical protein
MDWNPEELVTWKGAKLLSRPDLETRELKGHKTPQHIGRGEFSIEHNGEVRKIIIGAYYWDAAVEQFDTIQGDVVDVIFLPYPWSLGHRRGIQFYFYKIANQGEL